MFQHVAITKEDLKDRLAQLDALYTEQLDDMRADLEKVRTMAKEQVAAKEKELQDLVTTQVNKLENEVKDNTEDMLNERKATLAKYAKQFDQIKLVCCKYFEKYDIELETVKIKAKSVMDKYQDWSKVLIEPASLNDARLYSLESRIHEEEEMRMKEFEFLKDLTKKLIYSLEQQSVNQVDGLAKMSVNLDLSGQVLNQPSVSKSPSAMGKNKS